MFYCDALKRYADGTLFGIKPHALDVFAKSLDLQDESRMNTYKSIESLVLK